MPEPGTQDEGLLLRPHVGVQSVGCAMMHFLNHQEQVNQLGDVVPKPTQLTLRVTVIKTQASSSSFFSSACLTGIPPERGDRGRGRAGSGDVLILFVKELLSSLVASQTTGRSDGHLRKRMLIKTSKLLIFLFTYHLNI